MFSVMICIFNWEEFIYGTFEDCIDGFAILIIAPLISESLLGNIFVTIVIFQKCLDTISS